MTKPRRSRPRKSGSPRAATHTPRGPGEIDEIDLPAGFLADGSRMATLREVLDPRTPTRAHAHLSEDHRFDLAAKRFELAPASLTLEILGRGPIGRMEAIAEIRGRTRLGRHLLELQEIAIEGAIARGRR